MKKVWLFILNLLTYAGYGQNIINQVPQDDRTDFLVNRSHAQFYINDSTMMLVFNCRSRAFLPIHLIDGSSGLPSRKTAVTSNSFSPSHAKAIVVHGNVLYNLMYRSYIDTPFAQNDLVQQLVQTNLNVLLFNKYPLTLSVRSRSSNSPYFRNTLDIQTGYSQKQLLSLIKGKVKSEIGSRFDEHKLKALEAKYKEGNLYRQELQQWLQDPKRMEEILNEKKSFLRRNVQSRVNAYKEKVTTTLSDTAGLSQAYSDFMSKGYTKYRKFSQEVQGLQKKAENRIDSATQSLLDRSGIDSMKNHNKYREIYESKKKELALWQDSLKRMEQGIKKWKKNMTDSLAKIQSEADKITDRKELKKFISKYGITRDSITRLQRMLLAVDKFSLGRTWLDYSELTVKNIAVTGLNTEVYPGNFYFAFAAGKVNYRFRDFIAKDRREIPDQSLYLLRAGIRAKNKTQLIFTFYNGKKSLLNASSVSDPVILQRVLGFSAELKFRVNANNQITGEIAKSSFQPNSNQQRSAELIGKALNWRIRSNEAISLKWTGNFPSTETNITASVKKVGQDFQSYNLNPINTNQDAWMIKLKQHLWKRKLVLDAAIRKNEFESPYGLNNFSSSTVFKSLQMTLRVPKYPFLSVGFYPVSQLSFNAGNILTENRYNSLNIISGYSYRFKKIAMNNSFVYTRFYNQGADTGFVYYNATSYSFNHSVFLNRFIIQTNLSYTNQEKVDLLTLEEQVSWQIKQHFSLIGGLKWNRFQKKSNLFGYSSGVNIGIRKLGSIQLNVDKYYLPSFNGQLQSVQTGRVSLLSEF